LDIPSEADDDTTPAGDSGHHVPVLLAPVLDALNPLPGDVAIDSTLGLAGHATALSQRLAPGGFLLGIDRDPALAKLAEARLAREVPDGVSFRVAHGNASELQHLLDEAGLREGFDLYLMDCGVCSVHFDDATRGFSFRHDGPLSMKLDPAAAGPDAADVVNEATPGFIKRLLAVYGEEPQAGRITETIVRERALGRIATTGHLARLVDEAYPARFKGGRRHPATRTFQALRIFVNDELGSLAAALRESLTLLRIGGRAAYISFHSLEDRLVKQALKAASDPMFQGTEARLRGRGFSSLEITRDITATREECDLNPRARSARLRACTKIAPLPESISWPHPPPLPAWQL